MADFKNNVQKLVSKLDSVDESYDERNTFADFIRPLFEEMGWNFQSDVKLERYDNSEANAFQIDGVTRFYLKEFPLSSSMESLKDEITSAVSYAYNKGVTWVIATNFKEMRVYNTESTGRTLASMQHHSFLASEYIKKFENLSDLTKKQFSLNVLDSDAEYFGKKPKRVSIDKQLLEDLLGYRNILVDDIAKENSISEDDVEFAAQKILNRLIFIRSCGDRQIENRYLLSAMHEWEKNKDKKLSYYLQEIFSYFRGRYGSTLFEKHLCDEVIISDKVLQQVIEGTYQSKKKAVRYNFAHIEHDSLGKMYENYLGTIQQKKDGAYYTPSYISKYICQNTIIPYLSKSNVTNIPDLISEYSDNLEELEAKIHDIKVLDPACGTGEFLIRAIDVLLEISTQIQAQKEASGQYTHTVKGKKSGSVSYQTFGKDVENKEIRRIIQNNIHGVDINEQAIEITQLNMFLKLATSSQQLIDLSKNIIIGNSIVDDPNVDPKAFNLKKNFSGKFDIIIGNPPYVRQEKLVNIKPFLEKNYSVYSGVADLYVYFFELGISMLKDNGIFSIIVSNKFTKSEYGKKLREYLLNYKFNTFIDFGDLSIFDNASTYVCIVNFQNNKPSKFVNTCKINSLKFSNISEHIEKIMKQVEIDSLKKTSWNFSDPSTNKIFNKMLKNSIEFKDLVNDEFYRGVTTGLNNAFVINEEKRAELISEDSNSEEIIFPYLSGQEIKRYSVEWKKKYLIFTKHGTDISHYPAIKKHLELFHKKLQPKKNSKEKRGRKPGKYKWYEIQDTTNYWKIFLNKGIIYPHFNKKSNFTMSSGNFFLNAKGYQINNDAYWLLAILNSKLINFYLKSICPFVRGEYYEYNSQYIKKIPITLNRKYSNQLDNLCQKIIKNQKKIINKKDMEIELQNNDKLEKMIDNIVYKLYDITDEEKAIIESSA